MASTFISTNATHMKKPSLTLLLAALFLLFTLVMVSRPDATHSTRHSITEGSWSKPLSC